MVEILAHLIALHQVVPLVLMLNFLSFLETDAKKSEMVKNLVTCKKSFICSNQANCQVTFSTYESIILTKYYHFWTKIMHFLVRAQCGPVRIFLH